jgi:nitrite reductase/ring-hydroxylating ferredoxin subunit
MTSVGRKREDARMNTTGTETKGADIGELDSFEHGKPRIVKAGNRELVVYRWGDRVVALRNVCAHQGMSFRGGAVFGRLYSEERRGDVRFENEEPELICPVHGYTYDASGQCTTHPHLRIKAYQVEIRDGHVFVDTGP